MVVCVVGDVVVVVGCVVVVVVVVVCSCCRCAVHLHLQALHPSCGASAGYLKAQQGCPQLVAIWLSFLQAEAFKLTKRSWLRQKLFLLLCLREACPI